jgi:hypothetical protein
MIDSRNSRFPSLRAIGPQFAMYRLELPSGLPIVDDQRAAMFRVLGKPALWASMGLGGQSPDPLSAIPADEREALLVSIAATYLRSAYHLQRFELIVKLLAERSALVNLERLIAVVLGLRERRLELGTPEGHPLGIGVYLPEEIPERNAPTQRVNADGSANEGEAIEDEREANDAAEIVDEPPPEPEPSERAELDDGDAEEQPDKEPRRAPSRRGFAALLEPAARRRRWIVGEDGVERLEGTAAPEPPGDKRRAPPPRARPIPID